MPVYVTIADLADELGVSKNAVRRYITKHGFKLQEIHPAGARGQVTHALTRGDADEVKEVRRREGYDVPEPALITIAYDSMKQGPL